MGKENYNTGGALIPMVGKVIDVDKPWIRVEHSNGYYKGEDILVDEYLPLEGQKISYTNSEGSVRWRMSAENEELEKVQENDIVFFNLRGSWVLKK